MTDIMHTIYEYIRRTRIRSYVNNDEYDSLTYLLNRLERKAEEALSKDGKEIFQRYLDTDAELDNAEAEAMFCAAFAAARELG